MKATRTRREIELTAVYGKPSEIGVYQDENFHPEFNGKTEIWRKIRIPGLEDYEVSDMGRVRSLKCRRTRVLKPIQHSRGEDFYVNLGGKLGYNFYRISKLVALTFLPPNYEEYPKYKRLIHLNGNKDDNRACNLEWRATTDRRYWERTNKKKVQGIPVFQFTLDGKFIKKFVSANAAGRALGILATSITACCHGRNRSAGGFIWRKTPPENKIITATETVEIKPPEIKRTGVKTVATLKQRIDLILKTVKVITETDEVLVQKIKQLVDEEFEKAIKYIKEDR